MEEPIDWAINPTFWENVYRKARQWYEAHPGGYDEIKRLWMGHRSPAAPKRESLKVQNGIERK
jgi:hypothetical protein